MASVVAVLTRQQGLLFAIALMLALLVQVEIHGRAEGLSLRRRLHRIALWFAIFILSLTAGQHVTTRTIATRPVSSTMDGLRLIMLYDLAGMWANGAIMVPRGADSIPEPLRDAVRATYSPERVDGVLAVPGARDWAASIDRSHLSGIWWETLRESPSAFLHHLCDAGWALLGGFNVQQCLPGYWGVAGPPQMLEALGMVEAMDPRDRQIGCFALGAAATPWFWNISYVVLLLIVSPFAWRRRGEAPELVLLTLGGGVYV